MLNYVFICYSHQDRVLADDLAAKLEAAGFPAWYDKEIVAGDVYAPAIEKRINTASTFVPIITPQSRESRWVIREVSYAQQMGIPIVPYLAEGTLPLWVCECNAAISIDELVGSVRRVFGREGVQPVHRQTRSVSSIKLGSRDKCVGKPPKANIQVMGSQACLSEVKQHDSSLTSQSAKSLHWGPDALEIAFNVDRIGRYRLHVETIPAIISTLGNSFGWGERAVLLVRLVIGELMDNAFEHGCASGEKTKVCLHLSMNLLHESLVVTVKDKGPGFDMDRALASDFDLVAGARGRGLRFVKHYSSYLASDDGGRVISAVLNCEQLEHCPAMETSTACLCLTDYTKEKSKEFADSSPPSFRPVAVADIIMAPHLKDILKDLRASGFP